MERDYRDEAMRILARIIAAAIASERVDSAAPAGESGAIHCHTGGSVVREGDQVHKVDRSS